MVISSKAFTKKTERVLRTLKSRRYRAQCPAAAEALELPGTPVLTATCLYIRDYTLVPLLICDIINNDKTNRR